MRSDVCAGPQAALPCGFCAPDVALLPTERGEELVHDPCTSARPPTPADDAPSKVWPISAGTAVSEVQAQQYNLRHKHTSTLMAVARGEGAPTGLPLRCCGCRTTQHAAAAGLLA